MRQLNVVHVHYHAMNAHRLPKVRTNYSNGFELKSSRCRETTCTMGADRLEGLVKMDRFFVFQLAAIFVSLLAQFANVVQEQIRGSDTRSPQRFFRYARVG